MARNRSGRKGNGVVKEAVATVGLVAMACGGAAGTYLGFLWSGLGGAFLGLLAGAAVGFGIIYCVTNVVRQNSRFFSLLFAILAIGLIAWALHALGDWLRVNPG